VDYVVVNDEVRFLDEYDPQPMLQSVGFDPFENKEPILAKSSEVIVLPEISATADSVPVKKPIIVRHDEKSTRRDAKLDRSVQKKTLVTPLAAEKQRAIIAFQGLSNKLTGAILGIYVEGMDSIPLGSVFRAFNKLIVETHFFDKTPINTCYVKVSVPSVVLDENKKPTKNARLEQKKVRLSTCTKIDETFSFCELPSECTSMPDLGTSIKSSASFDQGTYMGYLVNYLTTNLATDVVQLPAKSIDVLAPYHEELGESLVYKYVSNCVAGTCGSILIILTSTGPVVCGAHVYGSDHAAPGYSVSLDSVVRYFRVPAGKNPSSDCGQKSTGSQ